MARPEETILQEVEHLRSSLHRPVVVAIDGGSGAGKSTIARKVARLTHTAIVTLDDFYQTVIPESEWPHRSVDERLNAVFDWHRVRKEALEPLRNGTPGRWRAFDFLRGLGDAGTYRLREEITEVSPASTVILEGAYSAAPPLRDLIDLAVLIAVPTRTRHSRAATRERDDAGFLAAWHAIWDDVETHYFQNVCPPESFDLVIQNNEAAEQASRPNAAESPQEFGRQ